MDINKKIKRLEVLARLKIFKEDFTLRKERFLRYKSDTGTVLTVLIDDSIKLNFFIYKYKLLNKLVDEENLKLASIEDIRCIKLSAITGRAVNKDYVDIY